jgi:hypothetical protein
MKADEYVDQIWKYSEHQMDQMVEQVVVAINKASIHGKGVERFTVVDTNSRYYRQQYDIAASKWNNISYSARETAYNTALADMAKLTAKYTALEIKLKEQAVHTVNLTSKKLTFSTSFAL